MIQPRAEVPPYGVFFTWDIHFRCNYSCPYCFFDKIWPQLAEENRYPGADKWIEVWEGIHARYGPCNIHITGGELSSYPDFLRLAAALAQRHFLELDTNLSLDAESFVARIPPRNVRFAATFHPVCTDIDSFLRRAVRLRDSGFPIRVDFVAYPPQLANLPEYAARFQKSNMDLQVIPFRGEYQGRQYPGGYTDQERAAVLSLGGKPFSTGQMMEKYAAPDASRLPLRNVCRMGQMYAKIRPDGTAHRCCKVKDSGKLGNLLEGTFKLLDDAAPCDYSDECTCWRAMVLGREENWLRDWVFPFRRSATEAARP